MRWWRQADEGVWREREKGQKVSVMDAEDEGNSSWMADWNWEQRMVRNRRVGGNMDGQEGAAKGVE